MKCIDITADSTTTYRLKENEQAVFFMLNRSGEITFDMNKSGAQAHVFSFFLLQDPAPQALHVIQKHRAPHTVSKALVKAALAGTSSLSYTGLITIEKNGNLSEAFQESRALLLSHDARMHALPALEILAPDVRCHHAATTSPLNKDFLYFAETRGLPKDQARELLIRGFFQEALEQMEKLAVEKEAIRAIKKKIDPLLKQFSSL